MGAIRLFGLDRLLRNCNRKSNCLICMLGNGFNRSVNNMLNKDLDMLNKFDYCCTFLLGMSEYTTLNKICKDQHSSNKRLTKYMWNRAIYTLSIPLSSY